MHIESLGVELESLESVAEIHPGCLELVEINVDRGAAVARRQVLGRQCDRGIIGGDCGWQVRRQSTQLSLYVPSLGIILVNFQGLAHESLGVVLIAPTQVYQRLTHQGRSVAGLELSRLAKCLVGFVQLAQLEMGLAAQHQNLHSHLRGIADGEEFCEQNARTSSAAGTWWPVEPRSDSRERRGSARRPAPSRRHEVGRHADTPVRGARVKLRRSRRGSGHFSAG